jgi:hypothetical protein
LSEEIPLSTPPDNAFLERSDALVSLANTQVASHGRRKVSESFAHGAARFNAWLTACGVNSGDELRAVKEEALTYFTAQYRRMLSESLDDYARNFERYMRSAPPSQP